jgi:hypothetical protein
MSDKFRSELVSVAGISDSRKWDTDSAVSMMHNAVCKMDGYNRRAFFEYVDKCGGFKGLLERFARLEDLNDFS